MDIAEFKKCPIMGIIRGVKEEIIEPLTETLISSGLKTVEITMNTFNAPCLIKKMIKCANGRLSVGAGTVLNMQNVLESLENGASFIVSPIFIPEVVEYCSTHSIPSSLVRLLREKFFMHGMQVQLWLKFFQLNFMAQNILKKLKVH